MSIGGSASVHSARDAALGFYFQTSYALLIILREKEDGSAICLERLDDVELATDGGALLMQLKHSMASAPAPLGIKTVALWKTLKAWIDVLPQLTLSETRFHLVTVAALAPENPLACLLEPGCSREALHKALVAEANRVLDERRAAEKAGKTTKELPHQDRFAACETFLALDEGKRSVLLERTTIIPSSPNIAAIEDLVVSELTLFPQNQREALARRLIGWWDTEVVYTLCGKREPYIGFAEVQQAISQFAAELERDMLVPEFESLPPPEDYQPDGMLARQIGLVNGSRRDLEHAIREEWRAREQRSKWMNERLGMATTIDRYDKVLEEHWSDKHGHMADECLELGEPEICARGLQLLRWSHEAAYKEIRPIAPEWSAAYYIRGSYQVLAIDLRVGWHANYKNILTGDE